MPADDFSLRAASLSDASVRHLSAVRHRRTLEGSPRKPPRSSSENMSSSSRPRSFAPRTKATWLCLRRTRSGSGSSRRLGSSARMASTGVLGARALSRRQSTTPSHRPSQNACRLVRAGLVDGGSGCAAGNGTRRERGRDLSEGSEPSRGARRTGTRLVSARVQAVAGRRRDPRVEHLATRDGLVPRRHGRGNGAGGRDASHRTCRVPRGAKSRDGFVRFLTARCPTDVAGRKREVLELLSQPNIAYVATDRKSCAAIGRSIQLRIPVCFVTSSPCRADHS